MTIGIAASGRHAGEAIRRALEAVERIGSGDIGGFVALAAVTADGRLLRCETQRGGIAAAMANADAAGTAEAILASPLAALMSSGPDRPEPLSQFVPGDPLAGLVTGHRRPDLPGPDGRALNLVALDRLRLGLTAEQALEQALSPAPEIDAGLLVAQAGRVAAADSERVQRRSDRGLALKHRPDGRAAGVVHNSISPVAGLADLAAGIVLEALREADSDGGTIALEAGTPVEAGERDVVEIDGENKIRRIISANPHLPGARRWTGAAVYLGSLVRRDGLDLGWTVTECFARLEGDRVAEVAAPGSVRYAKDRP